MAAKPVQNKSSARSWSAMYIASTRIPAWTIVSAPTAAVQYAHNAAALPQNNPHQRTNRTVPECALLVAGFFLRGRIGGMSTGDNDLDDDDESTGILDLLTRERTTDRRSLFVGLLVTALGALIFVARLIYMVTR
jgi:hypothetical protein